MDIDDGIREKFSKVCEVYTNTDKIKMKLILVFPDRPDRR